MDNTQMMVMYTLGCMTYAALQWWVLYKFGALTGSARAKAYKITL